MRIGIDCRTILNPSSGELAGIGYYTFNLVKQVIAEDRHNEYVLYLDYRTRDIMDALPHNVRVKHFPFSQYGRFLPFGYSHMLISAYLIKEGLDIYHVPAGNVPFTYPKKVIYTVHDLAIFKNPGWFPSQILSRYVMAPRSLKSADHIIAVSRSTKQDIKELFNIKDTKVTVVYEGADVEKIPLKRKQTETTVKFKLPKRYILFVGTIEVRKNLVMLVRAYKRFLGAHASHADVALVLAGHKGYKHEQVFDEIKEQKLGKQIRYLGYVSHNEKIELMKHAEVFAFPSLYEGFGLPVLEAMTLGVPVITSKVSAMREVADSAAILINPEDEQRLAQALEEVLGDQSLRNTLTAKGLKQAKRFSWQQCARETIAVYHKVGKK